SRTTGDGSGQGLNPGPLTNLNDSPARKPHDQKMLRNYQRKTQGSYGQHS
ncbi:transmembrane protein 184B, partial [Biomphalaria glabrata]